MKLLNLHVKGPTVLTHGINIKSSETRLIIIQCLQKRFTKGKKLCENLDSPAKSWRTAKEFMNWHSVSGPPSQLQINGNLVSKASMIASAMNSFFVRKIDTIREDIEYIPNNFESCHKIIRGKKCRLKMDHVSLAKVKRLLLNLKDSKSTSIDELDSFCVKVSAEQICRPVHHIITLSLMQCKFPSSWKFSKLIPLHKKGSKLDMKNYRPVAILSPISKILEKVVFEQIYRYFKINKIFHPNLHGFRENRSTQTALMTMYDR